MLWLRIECDVIHDAASIINWGMDQDDHPKVHSNTFIGRKFKKLEKTKMNNLKYDKNYNM